ncbi:MAG: DUF4410 domain-containing protein [Pseudomonadota bacterium]|jgi:hypothetical protein
MKFSTAAAPFVLLGALWLVTPGGALANVTRLMAPDSRVTADLSGYDRIVVLAPEAALEKPSTDPEGAKAVEAQIAERGAEFADGLAARLRASGAYAEVGRGSVVGRALVVRGRVLRFRDANLAQRVVGLFQGARLEIAFEIVDNETGALLGRAEADFSGGLRPGSWTNLVRSMDGFLNGTAARLTDELLVAGGFRQREEVGRAARQREKYRSD